MFLIDFLATLPLWLLGFVLFFGLVGFSLAALWAVRRWLLPRLCLTYEDAEFASAAVQCAMLLYALIAALIAVGVWQRHEDVSSTVSAEATAISSLWRDLAGYPEPTRTVAHDILRGYTEQVINDAWPLMQKGQIPSVGVKWLDRLQAELFAFEPKTDGQKIVHGEVLRAYNNFVLHRRHRLDCIHAALPGVFWFVLLPGAFGSMVLFAFFHINNVRFQALMTACVAGFVSMVLFVIMAMDRPFSGGMGITPDSYQLVFDHHMKK